MLCNIPIASLADAVVMASAALRGGGVVYTGDEGDLLRLQRHFPTVLLLTVWVAYGRDKASCAPRICAVGVRRK